MRDKWKENARLLDIKLPRKTSPAANGTIFSDAIKVPRRTSMMAMFPLTVLTFHAPPKAS